MRLIPCSLKKANDFIEVYHRHSIRTARDGGKWAIGCAEYNTIVGVAIVGNPLSASFMDSFTAEVLRVCVLPSAPRNCNSFLYGACRRIWFAMGGQKLITYTLTTETGESLRGAGWICEEQVRGHNPTTWGKTDHLQTRTYQTIISKPKYRWAVYSEPTNTTPIVWPATVNKEVKGFF